jgi:hypothetical protein
MNHEDDGEKLPILDGTIGTTGAQDNVIVRANFKTSPFAQYLRQAQILILEIRNVFLWLKFSPSLTLNPAVSGKHFETASSFHILVDNRRHDQ